MWSWTERADRSVWRNDFKQVSSIGSLSFPPSLPPSLSPSLSLPVVHSPILAPLLPQVTCLSTGCLLGTYSSTSTAAIGDLQSGSDVCLPCDPLCAGCIGPGILPGECIQCRYATRFSEGCVRSCNATTGEDGC